MDPPSWNSFILKPETCSYVGAFILKPDLSVRTSPGALFFSAASLVAASLAGLGAGARALSEEVLHQPPCRGAFFSHKSLVFPQRQRGDPTEIRPPL